MVYLLLIAIVLLGLLGFYALLRSRNMQYWIASYIREKLLTGKISEPKYVYFCLADHYEPYYGKATQQQARALVDEWIREYKTVAAAHHDSKGRSPKHSYFYPEEEYDEYVLDRLAEICQEGYGDLDVHLHHDNDTAENLQSTLANFKHLLHDRHQLLRKNSKGDIEYGFIHGNWALDNSRPDGRWCGVDNEIDVLLKTGCAFDMTMPSAPSDTQTRTINSIYYAKEDGCAKSHDTGRFVIHGKTKQQTDELLMIQGPLTLNWNHRKLGLIPRIESGELSADAPPSIERIKLWADCHIAIQGKEEHFFIKVHTHGLQRANLDMFFRQGGFEKLWSGLESEFRDKDGCELHYLTAWEMYLKVKELEQAD